MGRRRPASSGNPEYTLLPQEESWCFGLSATSSCWRHLARSAVQIRRLGHWLQHDGPPECVPLLRGPARFRVSDEFARGGWFMRFGTVTMRSPFQKPPAQPAPRLAPASGGMPTGHHHHQITGDAEPERAGQCGDFCSNVASAPAHGRDGAGLELGDLLLRSDATPTSCTTASSNRLGWQVQAG